MRRILWIYGKKSFNTTFPTAKLWGGKSINNYLLKIFCPINNYLFIVFINIIG